MAKRNTLGLQLAVANGVIGQGLRSFNAGVAEELLMDLENESFDEQFKDLRFRDAMTVTEGSNLATSGYKWSVAEVEGEAALISGYADSLPSATFKESGKSTGVRMLGASYHYNILEIAQAQATGDPLEDNRAMAARYSMEKKLNSIAFNGMPKAGLFGLFGHPDITPNGVALNAAATSTKFADKSALEIVADFNYAVSVMVGADDSGKYMPTHIYIPLQQFMDISMTAVPATSGKTIIAYLVENNPYITEGMIMPLQECDGAGSAGDDVMIFMDKNSRYFDFKIPYRSQFMPAQVDGLGIKRPIIATCGGLVVRQPNAIQVFEGI